MGALLSVVAMAACGQGSVPRWAVQHAVVEVTADGIEGYQVWEFYSKQWRRKQEAKFHLCSRVQVLSGSLVSAPSDCGGCRFTYKLELAETETDCDGDVATSDAYAGPLEYGVGEVPAELKDTQPYPGQTLGWYVSWDGQTTDEMGWAWNEDADVNPVETGTRWSEGDRFVFWPSVAWQL